MQAHLFSPSLARYALHSRLCGATLEPAEITEKDIR